MSPSTVSSCVECRARSCLPPCAVLGVFWPLAPGTLSTHLNSCWGRTRRRPPTSDPSRETLAFDGCRADRDGRRHGRAPVVADSLWLAFAARGRSCARHGRKSPLLESRSSLVACSSLPRSTRRASTLGPATEERYYFYVAPLLIVAGWRGAAGSAVPSATCGRQRRDSRVRCAPSASTESGRSRGELLRPRTCHGAVRSGTSRERPYGCAGPGGLGNADLVAAMFALDPRVSLLSCGRCFPTRGEIVALGFAAGLQFVVTVTCVLSVAGTIPGIAGRTNGPSFARLGFADRGSSGDEVTWLDNQPKVLGPPRMMCSVGRCFIMTASSRRASIVSEMPTIPDNFPLSSLPIEYVEVGKHNGPPSACRLSRSVG